MTCACAQAGSSVRPSSTGAIAARLALAMRASARAVIGTLDGGAPLDARICAIAREGAAASANRTKRNMEGTPRVVRGRARWVYRHAAPVDPGMRQPGVLEGWHPLTAKASANRKECEREVVKVVEGVDLDILDRLCLSRQITGKARCAQQLAKSLPTLGRSCRALHVRFDEILAEVVVDDVAAVRVEEADALARALR